MPHEHTGRSVTLTTSMRSHYGHSPTPMIVTSGSPTSSAHMRVGSDSTGAPGFDDVRHRQTRRAPVPRPGPTPEPSPHPQIRRAVKPSSRRTCLGTVTGSNVPNRSLGMSICIAERCPDGPHLLSGEPSLTFSDQNPVTPSFRQSPEPDLHQRNDVPAAQPPPPKRNDVLARRRTLV